MINSTRRITFFIRLLGLNMEGLRVLRNTFRSVKIVQNMIAILR